MDNNTWSWAPLSYLTQKGMVTSKVYSFFYILFFIMLPVQKTPPRAVKIQIANKLAV